MKVIEAEVHPKMKKMTLFRVNVDAPGYSAASALCRHGGRAIILVGHLLYVNLAH